MEDRLYEVEPEEGEEETEARSESRSREDVARIATFNIKIFGETKMGKADVISELVNITLRYDMLVVQEIKDLDQTVPYDFLDAINAEANETYALVLSERSGQQDDDQGGQEQYAIYYRTARFQADSAWLHNDSELDQFQREPLIANFNLLSNNGTVIEDIAFITVHTKPANAVNETAALHDVVETYNVNSTESDVALLGDFNADCSYASTYELNQLEIRNQIISGSFLILLIRHLENTHRADRIGMTSDVDGRFFGRWGGSKHEHWMFPTIFRFGLTSILRDAGMIRRASIPGRINIIGEHTDYAGGCSLVFASQRLLLEADFNHPTIEGDDTVVALWMEAGGPPAKLSVQSSIPTGKGMSSSGHYVLPLHSV